MKKVLFIDRDGTIIKEPPVDFQIDSLEKLSFVPQVFQYLSAIVKEMDYELVMVSNQDGLGTESFPESDFYPAHNKMLDMLKDEGIVFREILIDRSFESNPSAGRKPATGMLQEYLYGSWDLENSYVIGDRASDIELAGNIGAKAIALEALHKLNVPAALSAKTNLFLSDSWASIYRHLKDNARTIRVERKTKETAIVVELKIDGEGKSEINTGLSFLDHMIDQIARHALCDLRLEVKGDLEVDEHHSIEDAAIVLGEAFRKALGSKKGIQRYGFVLPMDDCLSQLAIDFGGRAWLVWDVDFKREKIGDVPTEMFVHFFKSFSDAAACNLNIKAEGENEHHKIESIFKALARSIKQAIRFDERVFAIPTTKGTLS